MTRTAIGEYLTAIRQRYLRATKREKGWILNEAVQVTGYHRKAVIRALTRQGRGPSKGRRGRRRRYGPQVVELLRVLWEVADRICSQRLHPFLPELIQVLRQHGDRRLTAGLERELVAMSPKSIDRLLKPFRQKGNRRPFSTTKPGSLLKGSIPIRTFADWQEHRPGFLEVDLVAAEDTRKARILFSRYEIKTPLTSYHEQGQRSRAPQLVQQLAEKDIALVSEAGMPSMSDPGYALIRAALEAGFRVEVVPGPSAITAALAVSGLPTDQFLFLGFLPRTAGQRRGLLTSVLREPRTLVALEAPHRLLASLNEMASLFGDRPMAVCREMTKLHEEIFRGSAREAAEHFRQPRGEFTLVIAGSRVHDEPVTQAEIMSRLRNLEHRLLTTTLHSGIRVLGVNEWVERLARVAYPATPKP